MGVRLPNGYGFPNPLDRFATDMLPKFLARFYHNLPIIRELDRTNQRLAQLHQAVTVGASVQARQLLEWLKNTDPRYADPKRLLGYTFQVCSQNGEDGIIQEIFRRIGTTDKVFYESGVGDGTENNTAFLLSLGWSGFWVDANPRFVRKLEKAGPAGGRLRHEVAKINRENIVDLLTHLGVPKEFDLFSLDIDQNTWYVWGALGDHFLPRVVAIEYNGVVPPEIEWKVEYDAERVWDGTQNFGASLKAYENLGRRLGYSLVGCDPFGANAFFVRNDLVGNHFAAPFTAENHFEPARFHLIHRMGLPNEILDSMTET